MAETVFTAQNLSKRYKKFLALDGFHMTVNQGDIYGFVGENGAGKTTLIRTLAGLIHPTGGDISIFGASDKAGLNEQRKKVGAIIEAPAVYPDLTAKQNLEIIRLQQGISDKGRVDEVLKTVDLSDTGKKKAKNFSLGMRQRLGLAMALLNRPGFLVLDEPVNGLDPVGIVDFRDLMKKLNQKEGVTILISSHILGELAQLTTCYGFVHKGKMVEEVSAADLAEKCQKYISLTVSDATAAAAIIEKELQTKNFKLLSENKIHLYEVLENNAALSKALFENGVSIQEMRASGEDLESYYMTLIGGADK
ncbi:bacitracin ABC transporter ATP-binding protein [Clostridia bacterium]|nr:bacitracin ABC transporter ATP-binding protein [Clostridia bacterium]